MGCHLSRSAKVYIETSEAPAEDETVVTRCAEQDFSAVYTPPAHRTHRSHPSYASSAGILTEEPGEDDPLVYLVDDSFTERKLTQRRLTHFLTCRISAFGDGSEVIARWPRSTPDCPHPKLPSLILMDFDMAQYDGAKTARILRGELAFTGPIIVLTGNYDADTRIRCAEAGVDDVIHKPLNSDGLRLVINKLPTGRLRTSNMTSTQGGSIRSNFSKTVTAASMNSAECRYFPDGSPRYLPDGSPSPTLISPTMRSTLTSVDVTVTPKPVTEPP